MSFMTECGLDKGIDILERHAQPVTGSELVLYI